MKWKPISEAPRDGTAILAYGTAGYLADGPLQYITYWNGDWWHQENSGLDNIAQPTHWMHLPDAPEKKMAHDPGLRPMLDAVEAAFNAAGEHMPWASTVAQSILDMPTAVRCEVEKELRKRLLLAWITQGDSTWKERR